MRRILSVAAVAVVIASACTSGGDSGGAAPTSAQCTTKGLSLGSGSNSASASGAQAVTTINLWSFYTGGEFKKYCEVLQDFHQKYPNIAIQHTGGKSDQDILRAVSSGTAPDLAISMGPDNVAKFCSSGAYSDLTTDLQNDGIDLSKEIPEPASRYTSFEGNQCTLPVLSDAYGLYYNKDMFQAAGIAQPPKTLSQLESDAKKLTTFNPDGSIKVAGFVPLSSFYELQNFYNGAYTGGVWYDANGKSAFASDPSWAALLEWDKAFIENVYGSDGYDKLQQYFAEVGGPNSEWSSAQAFETEQLAMAFDGEWRNAFIQDDKAKINYGTAAFPVADEHPELFGAGQIGGDVLGIPSNAKHAAEAWSLLKYLALDTGAEVKLANTLKNIPTTFESLKDPGLNADEHFKPFMEIFANPHSEFKPLTPIGQTDADMWDAFIDKWESGQVPDLQAGLQQLASDIDQQMQVG
jgi:multiple sugar transport system substrate-binding protein